MKTLMMMAMGIVFLLGAGGLVYAQPAPTMYTLDNIYYYLVEGTEAAWGAHSLEPQSGVPGGNIPGYTKSLGDIYDDIKAKFGQCDASPGQVMDTATFFSADTDNWGPKAGTIPTRTVSNATVSQSAGYYAAFNLQTVDTDLAAGNIKRNVVIYGITGTAIVLLKTGQTAVYRTGDDGTYQKGTAFSYQTSDPAANGEIVTTDNVTGLMWASDGNGLGCYSGVIRTWDEAIDWAEGLTFAGYSDWRLPNITELQTLFVRDAGQTAPFINKTMFPNTIQSYYWSSTTLPGGTTYALSAHFLYGVVYDNGKTNSFYVRAVRGGE